MPEKREKNTVTDLGASNYVSFVKRIALGGNISLIDYLVVVTDTQERSQADAVATIQTFFNRTYAAKGG
jgi:hypothetical protein